MSETPSTPPEFEWTEEHQRSLQEYLRAALARVFPNQAYPVGTPAAPVGEDRIQVETLREIWGDDS